MHVFKDPKRHKIDFVVSYFSVKMLAASNDRSKLTDNNKTFEFTSGHVVLENS